MNSSTVYNNQTEDQIKFLKEIITVCKKHGFALSHNEFVPFTIEKYDENYARIVLSAINQINS